MVAEPAAAAAPAPGSTCKQQYAQLYSQLCHNCLTPTSRATIPGCPLRLRLCRDCWQAMLGPVRAHHRLLPGKDAAWCAGLSARDLAALPHAADENPLAPGSAWSTMRLYRKADVVRAGAAKAGGCDRFWAKYRARLKR